MKNDIRRKDEITKMILKYTQSNSAKKLGVSYNAVCRWEFENRLPQAIGIGRCYGSEEFGIDNKEAVKYGAEA